MSARSARHGSFVIDRHFDAAPQRVFDAWSDPKAKARWFAGPADKWTLIARDFDFRIGGSEHVKGRFAGGPVSAFVCRYYDIVQNERIVYAYDMELDGTRISVSLATVEFKPDGAGTRLVLTEQIAYLDDYDDPGARGREHGTRALLDNLDASLQAATA